MKSAQVTLNFGRFGWLLIAMLSTVTVAPACAADVNLQFEFASDSSNPGKKEFTNKTPVTGLCAEMPLTFSCGPEGGKGSSKIDVTIGGRIPNPAVDNIVQFKIPELRSFFVKGADGREYPVKLKITGVAARYDLSPSTVTSITGNPPPGGHIDLWMGGMFADAPPPCSSVQLENGMHPSQYRFVWHGNPGVICGKRKRIAFIPIPIMKLDSLSIVYQLDTPNPFEMVAGTYEGVTTYRMREDFNPGGYLQPSRPSFDVKVTLKVNHTFRVSLDSNDRKYDIQPDGGWPAWNDQGRPVKWLSSKYIAFNLETTSPFTMRVLCQFPSGGNNCGLKNSQNDSVGVGAWVSLPQGVTDDAGAPVRDKYLNVSWYDKFKVSGYVSGRGTLRFKMSPSEMAKMKTGTMYSGTVTVVWDSDI
ncbi:hypothetical protein [Pseudomonas sp. HY13-MNA-CIBAN-0226]|uniref:hypothetical protein n=1 Tax=Pseudomonas sp. HY13-MNA-CIBAN-0226 TaxID=3140473 RepID=UPI00331760A9